MENWRTRAIEVFRDVLPIEELVTDPFAEAPAIWTELYVILVQCYDEQPPNESLIARIYDFAWWCLDQPNTDNVNTDISNTAAVGLIEHLPLNRKILGDLHRWMTIETFRGCESLFRYHLDDAEYSKFSAEFLRKRTDFEKARA
jgi:hypothetical protein